MTAKETAQELVKHYLDIQNNISWTENEEVIKDLEEWYNRNDEAIKYWQILSRKSALICAEQNLSTLEATHRKLKLIEMSDLLEFSRHLKYWGDVVKELKSMFNE